MATDDPEIEAVATVAGLEVVKRGPALAEVPVNTVVQAVAMHLNWVGEVLLIQPTVQPITTKMLTWFLEQCRGQRSTALGYQEPHQVWIDGERVTPPVQRQEKGNWPVREVGIRWWPSADRIYHAETILQYPAHIGDIDTWADYVSSQQVLNLRERSTVIFSPLANERDGRGHLYRCLTLAPLFGAHRVMFYPAPNSEVWAMNLIQKHGWSTTATPVKADLVINDRLATSAELIYSQREWARVVVNLEDSGPGAEVADLTVNALYEDGGDWAVIRPEFFVGDYDLMREPSGEVLVMLNSDPAGMLQDVVAALDPWFNVKYMVPSDVPLAALMKEADVLVTSGGRTVFEAAAVGVPTVVIPQHERENGHGHLGRGRNLVARDPAEARAAVEELMTDRALRVRMSAAARIDGLGAHRIVHACEWLMKGYGGRYLSPGG